MKDINKVYNKCREEEDRERDLDGTFLPYPNMSKPRYKIIPKHHETLEEYIEDIKNNKVLGYHDPISFVPRRKDAWNHNDPTCSHCGVRQSIKTELNTIPWCEICYALLSYNVMTGKFFNPAVMVTIGKDLWEAEQGREKK